MLNKKLILVLFAFICVLFFCSTAAAANTTTTTTAGVEKPTVSSPVMTKTITTTTGAITTASPQYVVWSDNRDGNRTIYYKDINNKTSIDAKVSTYTGKKNQSNPVISGNRVVWVDYREGSNKPVIYWNEIGSKSADKRVSTYLGPWLTQINPDISGTRVVWTDYRESFIMPFPQPHTYLKKAIYWRDLVSGAGGRVSNYTNPILVNQINPSISGNRVVWEDYREGSDKPVIYWNEIGSKSPDKRVSTYTGNYLKQVNPAISGTKVVWTDYRESINVLGPGGTYLTRIKEVIYWRDLVSGAGGRVSNYYPKILSSMQQSNPSISGNRVVWEDYREGSDKPVIYWNEIGIKSPDKRVSTYTGSHLNQVNPDISGTKVVWTDKRDYYLIPKFPIGSGLEYIYVSSIYWRDLVSGAGGRVSNQTGLYLSNQENAAISGNRVVWVDYREGSGKPVIYWNEIGITSADKRVSTYTGNYLTQINPDISGTRVVWTDYRDSWTMPLPTPHTIYIKAIYWRDLVSSAGGRVSSYTSPLWLDQMNPSIS